MPLLKVTPSFDTDTAQFFEVNGRHFAIITVDPDVSPAALEQAREVFSEFLAMDVLMVGQGFHVEIVEAPAPTRHERLAADE